MSFDPRSSECTSTVSNVGAQMQRARWSETELTAVPAGRRQDFEVHSRLHTTQRILIRSGVLEPNELSLVAALRGRRAMCIVDQTVALQHAENCQALVTRLAAGSQLMSLPFSEGSKTLDMASDLMRQFESFEVGRRDVVIAVGGGVCCDVVSFAAAVYRRGIPHIKVPTTLLGLVDAGIGSKNAVNFNAAKNRLGTFYPPELSLLDPTLAMTQPYEGFRCGVAEIIKVAIVSSAALFDLMDDIAARSGSEDELRQGVAAPEVVSLAVEGLLRELANDLYEAGDLRRPADFGHSFSPYLEAVADAGLAHGDAVAFEMLVLSRLARNMGHIPQDYLARIERLYAAFKLPTSLDGVTAELMWAGLTKTVLHRGGRLNMPLPACEPGRCLIVEHLSDLRMEDLSAAVFGLSELGGLQLSLCAQRKTEFSTQ